MWSYIVKVRSLSSTSLAKVLGLTYLVLAVIFSPFLLIMASAEGAIGLAESVIVILAVIFFYGIAGGVGGFLIGTVYYFISSRFGGIEVELETA